MAKERFELKNASLKIKIKETLFKVISILFGKTIVEHILFFLIFSGLFYYLNYYYDYFRLILNQKIGEYSVVIDFILFLIKSMLWIFVINAILVLIIILLFALLYPLKYYLLKIINVYKNRKNKSKPLPKLTVIIPCFAEKGIVIKTVFHLIKQLDNKELMDKIRIIIVNDGSDKVEKKHETLKLLIKKLKLREIGISINEKEKKDKKIRKVYISTLENAPRIMVIDKENGGKYHALNTGIYFATTELIACIDADTLVNVKTLKKCLEFKRNFPKIKVIFAPVLPKPNCNPLTWLQLTHYVTAFYVVRGGMEVYNGNLLISGAFGIFEKSLINIIQGYEKTVGEDFRLMLKIQYFMSYLFTKYKMKTLYLIDAPPCWTAAQLNIQDMRQQFNRWARGHVQNILEYFDKFAVLGNNSNATTETIRNNLISMLSFNYLYNIELLCQALLPFGIIYAINCIIIGKYNALFIALVVIFVVINYLYSIVAVLLATIYRKNPLYLLLLLVVPFQFVIYILNVTEKIKALKNYKDMEWGRHIIRKI